MSTPAEAPHPSYARVQLTGPPETVALIMAALGEAGEIIFDHRSPPDDRGHVACTARVAVLSSPVPADASRAEAVVQSRLTVDVSRWPGLGGQAGAARLEDSAAAALTALDGVGEARSRLVAVAARPAR